ncbi:MAG: hypothetical protein AVDCRST_MAG54-4678, partial [uncultured Actinomycetospora sp.]
RRPGREPERAGAGAPARGQRPPRPAHRAVRRRRRAGQHRARRLARRRRLPVPAPAGAHRRHGGRAPVAAHPARAVGRGRDRRLAHHGRPVPHPAPARRGGPPAGLPRRPPDPRRGRPRAVGAAPAARGAVAAGGRGDRRRVGPDGTRGSPRPGHPL